MSDPAPGRLARIAGHFRARADAYLTWGGAVLALIGFALPVESGRPAAEIAATRVLMLSKPAWAAGALGLWTAVLGPAVAVALRTYGRERTAWAGGAAGLCAAGGCLASMLWSGGRPGIGLVVLGLANASVLASALTFRTPEPSAPSPWRPVRAGGPALAAVLLAFCGPRLAPGTLRGAAGLLARNRPPGWAMACDALVTLAGGHWGWDPRTDILQGLLASPGPDARATLERWIAADGWWWYSHADQAAGALLACGADSAALLAHERPELAFVGLFQVLEGGPISVDVARRAAVVVSRLPVTGGAAQGAAYSIALKLADLDTDAPLLEFLGGMEHSTGTAPFPGGWLLRKPRDSARFAGWLTDERRGVRIVAWTGLRAVLPSAALQAALAAYDPDAPPGLLAGQADAIRAALAPPPAPAGGG